MTKIRTVYLHEIEKNSKIKVTLANGKEAFVIFDHLDGMYSFCYLEGEPEKALHFSRFTPLKKVEDYYIVKE